ncbi:hypothetical protein G6F41_005753 [Rhizopus arrhizus]|nr:hypothetical protein G6F41_005753 [Rhizopus arrhizus]
MEVVSKRLLKELREIEKEAKAHPEIIDLSPESDDNLLHWRAILAGLPDTPYEDGRDLLGYFKNSLVTGLDIKIHRSGHFLAPHKP